MPLDLLSSYIVVPVILAFRRRCFLPCVLFIVSGHNIECGYLRGTLLGPLMSGMAWRHDSGDNILHPHYSIPPEALLWAFCTIHAGAGLYSPLGYSELLHQNELPLLGCPWDFTKKASPKLRRLCTGNHCLWYSQPGSISYLSCRHEFELSGGRTSSAHMHSQAWWQVESSRRPYGHRMNAMITLGPIEPSPQSNRPQPCSFISFTALASPFEQPVEMGIRLEPDSSRFSVSVPSAVPQVVLPFFLCPPGQNLGPQMGKIRWCRIVLCKI